MQPQTLNLHPDTVATRSRVFIGSSREALHVARGVKANLDEIAEVRVWDEDVFEPGRYTLDELLRFTRSFDFAVFVWSSDEVRDLPVFAFRNDAGGLYGAFKRHFNDLWHNQSRLGDYLRTTIEPEVSAGGILVSHIGVRAYIALVMRDDGSWVLPKGHKEVNDRDLELAAVREVSEETGVPTSEIRVMKRLDEYAYDETAVRLDRSKIVYLFLMQYLGSTLPELRSDPDHPDARWWPVDEPFPVMFYAYQRTLLAEVMKSEFGTELRVG